MSSRKTIQQYLEDNKLVTEFSDGSIEYTIPEQGKQYLQKGFKDQLRQAEGRLGGYSGPQKKVGGYNAQTNFPENINKMMDENDRLKAELEQMRKDEASLKAEKTGGGKLRLPSERQSRRFNSAGEMINDLYNRFEKGDKEAGRQLDELWSIPSIKDGILALEKQGFSMSECIRCHDPIIQGVDGRKCPNCSFDYSAKDREGFVLFT